MRVHCVLVGAATDCGGAAADSQIADEVKATLAADPDIYARHIDIAVDRGVVQLGVMSGSLGTFRSLAVTPPRSPALRR